MGRYSEAVSGRSSFALAVAIFALLVLATAASWEFAHDEGVSWDQAVGTFPLPGDSEAPIALRELRPLVEGERPVDLAGIVERLGRVGGMHPPLYYIGLASWMRLFGGERIVVVLPMLALGSILLGIAVLLARELAPGRLRPEWAAALLAVSPWWVGFVVYARPYAWVVVLAGVGTLAALRVARSLPGAEPGAPSLGQVRVWTLLLLVSSVAGLYSLYHYAFVVLWHGAMLGVVALGRRGEARSAALLRVFSLGATIALAFAPWVPTLVGHLAETRSRPWYFSSLLPPAQWPGEALRALRFFALAAAERASVLTVLAGLLGSLTAVLATLSFGRAEWRRLSIEARATWLCALVMPVGIAVSDVLRETHTFFLTKIHFAWALLLPLLVVRAAERLPRPAWGRALLGGWIVLQLAACGWALSVQRGESKLEARVAEIARAEGPRHRIVISTSLHGYAQSLVHALARAGVSESQIAVVSGPRLGRYVTRATRDPGVEHLTLVNLGAFYQPGAIWTSTQLQRAFDVAQAAGWRLVAQPKVRGDERRVLSHSLPLQVRYFSK